MLFGFRVPIMVMMKDTSIHESLPSGFDICYIYYTDETIILKSFLFILSEGIVLKSL